MGEPLLAAPKVQAQKQRKDGKTLLKDVGRENDARAEHKASSRSSDSLNIHPIRLGTGDTIPLLFETI